MDRFAAAALAAVILAAPGAAGAEINVADSIEWMTADSDLVVRGTVIQVGYIGEPGRIGRHEITIKVSETLEGPRRRTVRLNLRGYTDATLNGWRSNRTELLLFLVDSARIKDDLDGAIFPYTLRRQVIQLGTTAVHDMFFDVLTRRADVLAAVRAAASSSATRSHRVDVPYDSPAFQSLWGGSSVWLIVPIDRRLEQLALTWLTAKDVLRREEGINALAHFRSRANIRRLEPLLADPDFAIITPASGSPIKRYLARAAAATVLSAWSHPHATPVIEEPHPTPAP